MRTWALLFFLAGCRADAGEADLSRLGPIVNPPGFDEEPLLGPDPYEAGEARLSLGVFYEGGYSELIPPGPAVHYYIYIETPSGDLTYRQLPDEDRVEGLVADRLLHGGKAWWGGGVHFDVPQDMRRWDTLHVSLKSSSAAFEKVAIGMHSEDTEATVDAADYGYEANGEWQTLAIPLADFVEQGVELGAVTAAVTLGGGSGSSADVLKIDDLYFTGP